MKTYILNFKNVKQQISLIFHNTFGNASEKKTVMAMEIREEFGVSWNATYILILKSAYKI